MLFLWVFWVFLTLHLTMPNTSRGFRTYFTPSLFGPKSSKVGIMFFLDVSIAFQCFTSKPTHEVHNRVSLAKPFFCKNRVHSEPGYPILNNRQPVNDHEAKAHSDCTAELSVAFGSSYVVCARFSYIMSFKVRDAHLYWTASICALFHRPSVICMDRIIFSDFDIG